MTQLSRELRRALAALGSNLNPQLVEQTRALFAPIARRLDPATSRVVRDLAYGAHERHRLDIFSPVGDSEARPIVVFAHGGGFSMGSKGGAAEPFFSNIGAWATRAGFIGVTLNYRLAPEFKWPSGAEDLDLAVAWLNDNITLFGGDPSKIILVGQSAGAVHVAGYLTLSKHHGRAPLAGAAMLSGIYDLVRHDRMSFEDDYFGENLSKAPEQSTLGKLFEQRVPCLFTVSELDPLPFQRQAAHLVERALSDQGKYPSLLYLTGHNHLSPVYQLGCEGDGGDDVGEALETWVRDCVS